MSLVVREWSAADVVARQEALAEFERPFRYPLGSDTFRIDHGSDYAAFFRTLGEPHVLAATEGEDLCGVLVAVRRALPAADPAARPRAAWYVGDLKVATDVRSRAVGRRLLAAFDGLRRRSGTARAYGISMDPASGDNRVARWLCRLRGAGVAVGARLALFSLPCEGMRRAWPLCERALGPAGWADHRGRKDIVLASTGAPMPLLHLQHGALGRAEVAGPQPGSVHMFCLPRTHPLIAELAGIGVVATASATVLHLGMDDVDWSFVLTSDI